jgi:hypothetical protein
MGLESFTTSDIEAKYDSFINEHSLRNQSEADYYEKKIQEIKNGNATWMRKNFDSDGGQVYELFYDKRKIGYLDCEVGAVDVYEVDSETGHTTLVSTYDSPESGRRILTDAIMFLEAYVEAEQLLDTARMLDDETMWEYEAAISKSQEMGKSTFYIKEVPDDPNSFSADFIKGEQKLGKIVYHEGYANAYIGDFDFTLSPDDFTLQRAIYALRQSLEEN